jgi:hypothetical protein
VDNLFQWIVEMDLFESVPSRIQGLETPAVDSSKGNNVIPLVKLDPAQTNTLMSKALQVYLLYIVRPTFLPYDSLAIIQATSFLIPSTFAQCILFQHIITKYIQALLQLSTSYLYGYQASSPGLHFGFAELRLGSYKELRAVEVSATSSG